MAEEHVMPEAKCPLCGHRFDRCTNVTGTNRPNTGDVSLCIQCGSALVFVADGTMRLATRDDLADVQGSARDRMAQAQSLIHRLRHQRG